MTDADRAPVNERAQTAAGRFGHRSRAEAKEPHNAPFDATPARLPKLLAPRHMRC
jgi:hypothetical protein